MRPTSSSSSFTKYKSPDELDMSKKSLSVHFFFFLSSKLFTAALQHLLAELHREQMLGNYTGTGTLVLGFLLQRFKSKSKRTKLGGKAPVPTEMHFETLK